MEWRIKIVSWLDSVWNRISYFIQKVKKECRFLSPWHYRDMMFHFVINYFWKPKNYPKMFNSQSPRPFYHLLVISFSTRNISCLRRPISRSLIIFICSSVSISFLRAWKSFFNKEYKFNIQLFLFHIWNQIKSLVNFTCVVPNSSWTFLIWSSSIWTLVVFSSSSCCTDWKRRCLPSI